MAELLAFYFDVHVHRLSSRTYTYVKSGCSGVTSKFSLTIFDMHGVFCKNRPETTGRHSYPHHTSVSLQFQYHVWNDDTHTHTHTHTHGHLLHKQKRHKAVNKNVLFIKLGIHSRHPEVCSHPSSISPFSVFLPSPLFPPDMSD